MDAAAGVGLVFLLIGGVVLLGLTLVAAVSLFWVWMLIDCLRYTPDENHQKLVWALVIVFANWVGALVYFLVQRPQNRRQGR